MALAAGTRLGPYEILATLGAGGMGEVYRAIDTRLKRNVAVKVVSPENATDATYRQRFTQEALAASALNHPNIVVVYDVGQQGEISYIVSELVEGDSLRTLIRQGWLSIASLLDISVQIADGLTAAHARGIVHRDLKPENIMITAGPESTRTIEANRLFKRLIEKPFI
jgi:eukaryotic-like serine/threonine-protein kinase